MGAAMDQFLRDLQGGADELINADADSAAPADDIEAEDDDDHSAPGLLKRPSACSSSVVMQKPSAAQLGSKPLNKRPASHDDGGITKKPSANCTAAIVATSDADVQPAEDEDAGLRDMLKSRKFHAIWDTISRVSTRRSSSNLKPIVITTSSPTP